MVASWILTISSSKLGRRCVIAVLTGFLFTSCGHRKQARVNPPPPPAPSSSSTESAQLGELPAAGTDAPATTDPVAPAEALPGADEPAAALAEPVVPADTAPLTTETGLASWYGPPYHNRRGSNGEIYNMNAMTAAHRTFPLGSVARVTNLKTGHSAVVRITDRGPFISGRVVDLSLAAARKLDVFGPGTAQVRVELLQTPATASLGGKWVVQIGGFTDEDVATKLADRLTRRYHTAKVLRFASPAGDWWIRVRVLDDDHERAQKLAAETRTPEGAVFVVRLD